MHIDVTQIRYQSYVSYDVRTSVGPSPTMQMGLG